MKNVVVNIEFVGKNFGAWVEELNGCVATGNTPSEVKNNIVEAMQWHIESSLADGDPIAEVFKGEYELSYKFDTMSLLKYYKGILGNVGIERLTGINNKQLNHYATGHRKPSEGTKQKILNALHQFGQELISVEL